MQKLVTCDERLQAVCMQAVRYTDFAITEGHRTLDRQKELFAAGLTTLDGTTKVSKHMSRPSLAVDVVPYPTTIDGVSVWEEKRRFYFLAGVIMYAAFDLNIPLIWGGDWNSDQNFGNQKFFDLPHFEIRQ